MKWYFVEVSEGRDTLTEGRHEFSFSFDLQMGYVKSKFRLLTTCIYTCCTAGSPLKLVQSLYASVDI